MADKTSLPAEVSTVSSVFASSVGGTVTAAIMTPLDVLKTRMQSHKVLSSSKCFTYCNALIEHICTCSSLPARSGSVPWYKKPGNFVGTWVGCRLHRPSKFASNCVYHSGSASIGCLTQSSLRLSDAFLMIVRHEGVLSLWSGLSPTLVMALPQTVLYFTLNDWLKKRLGYHDRLISGIGSDKRIRFNDWLPALIGGVSRVFAVSAISPLELLRTKMQSYHMTSQRLTHVIVESVKHGGLSSLWTGMGPTLLRDVPFSTIFWFVFDYLKSGHIVGQLSEVNPYNQVGSTYDLAFHRVFFYGATAGLIAGICTHPFDVIKTHRQVELGESAIRGVTHTKSTWTALHRLYTSGGIQALFVGFTPRLVKTTVTSAVMIATYETLKRQFSGSTATLVI